MKVLVVGGTGMIGAHAALHLREAGDDVTVSSRSEPAADSPVADFPFLAGDYTEGTFTTEDLASFDAILFAAGQDPRHMPRDADADEFWKKTQSVGVPRFAEAAKKAGVGTFVQIGSYYHHYDPQFAVDNPYVESRKLADEGARALADDTFRVCTLNAPAIIGVIPGIATKRYRRMVSWAAGNEPQIPDFAPPGGTNYLSVRSIAQACHGALHRGETGKAYLIGDENLSYQQFFQHLVDAAGGDRTIEVKDDNHPMQPDASIIQGRGNTIAYEPSAAEVAQLGYDRNDCGRAIEEMVAKVQAAYS